MGTIVRGANRDELTASGNICVVVEIVSSSKAGVIALLEQFVDCFYRASKGEEVDDWTLYGAICVTIHQKATEDAALLSKALKDLTAEEDTVVLAAVEKEVPSDGTSGE